MGLIRWLLSTDFMPHEYCYLRNPSLIKLHLWSDLSIGIAYVAISITLVMMVRRGRGDIPFHWMFLGFGAFIIACGGTHFMEVWTLWNPVYWLAGIVKSATALASVATAVALPPLVPKALGLVRSAKVSDRRQAELEQANHSLEKEILERRKIEAEVRSLAAQLERRVQERTAELARANRELAEKAQIVEHSQDAILSWTTDRAITSWNPAAEKVYGYSATEMIGKTIMTLVPVNRRIEFDGLMQRIEGGEEVQPFETSRVRKDGFLIDTYVAVSPMRDENGRVRGVSVITRDITDVKRSEEQMRQSQKLESLGVIAGGVAHDFNNLLVGIMGNSSLALDTLPPYSMTRPLLEQVTGAADKAALLTQQLLAYAGKGRFRSERLDLSRVVEEIAQLIRTSIPKTVTLKLDLDKNLGAVEADPSQIEQVIMNLVINGAEAIGERPGMVRVTTGMQTVDDNYVHQNLAGEPIDPGNYVSIEVEDTGCGMDDWLRSRIFDPFFTTKFTGRGLGLSAVMGIVRSHKGSLRVHSEAQKGSTFRILLPALEQQPPVSRVVEPVQELRGSGLVLVVDDEEVVRLTAMAALKRYGYFVETAKNGREGVDLFRARKHQVVAVLLDMMMPVMSGSEALGLIREISPDARIVVSSGYDEIEATQRFTATGISAFIQKPYTAAKLARVIKRAIEEPAHMPAN